MIEAEKANETMMTVTRMCQLLGVDRRRFYEWRARHAAGPSPRRLRAAALTVQIREFHEASDGTYGAPRIHADLQDAGEVVSRKTVAKLLREASPSTWASLPQRGALAFFADAAAVCAKAPPRCPPARRLPAALIARVTKMQQALSSPAAIAASSWRRRDLQDVARIRPVLLALQQQTVRPDLHTDLVVVADRLQRRGRTADAAALRAFAPAGVGRAVPQDARFPALVKAPGIRAHAHFGAVFGVFAKP